VAPDAVALLVDTLGQLVTRSGKPDGTQLRLLVSATSPQRRFILESGETVTLTPADGAESLPELTDAGAQSLPELRLPAEALVRLVYGRLDPAHTPAVEARGVDLDELRRIFPGF
jgi:hypothetical protein